MFALCIDPVLCCCIRVSLAAKINHGQVVVYGFKESLPRHTVAFLDHNPKGIAVGQQRGECGLECRGVDFPDYLEGEDHVVQGLCGREALASPKK